MQPSKRMDTLLFLTVKIRVNNKFDTHSGPSAPLNNNIHAFGLTGENLLSPGCLYFTKLAHVVPA